MNAKSGNDQKHVKVFTTQTCAWCKAAKAYMIDNEIDYVEADIINDLNARREMVLMTGQYGVPVVLVGEKAMIGWDPKEFERLLER